MKWHGSCNQCLHARALTRFWNDPMILNITRECNMRCAYCRVDKDGSTMSYETVVSALKLSNDGDHIGFFGGEPLLHPRLVTSAMDCALGMHDDVNFSLTTNGTMFTEDLLDLLSEYPLFIALSHDGTRQSETRPLPDGGATGADDAARMLLQYDPGAIAMTTYRPEDVPSLVDDVSHLYGLGFRHISLNPDIQDDGYDIPGLESALLDILDCYGDVDFIGMRKGFVRGDCREKLFIETDGRIFGCISHADHPELCLGDVSSGVDGS